MLFHAYPKSIKYIILSSNSHMICLYFFCLPIQYMQFLSTRNPDEEKVKCKKTKGQVESFYVRWRKENQLLFFISTTLALVGEKKNVTLQTGFLWTNQHSFRCGAIKIQTKRLSLYWWQCKYITYVRTL